MIHDPGAMWDLAIHLKIEYERLVKDVLEMEEDGFIFVEGKMIDRDNKQFNKVLKDYMSRISVLEKIIEMGLKFKSDCRYTKYLQEIEPTK